MTTAHSDLEYRRRTGTLQGGAVPTREALQAAVRAVVGADIPC